MLSRRRFILSSTSTLGMTVAGCDIFENEYERPPGLPPFSIDIHAHIFNATDIPIPGFLNQVFIRSPEKPVEGNYTVAALIRLLTDILLLTVRKADEELAILPRVGAVSETDPARLQQQDKRVVAQGINTFERRSQSPRPLARSAEAQATARREAAEDTQLLQELNRLANRGPIGLRSKPDLGPAVSEAIFDPPANTTLTLRAAGGDFDLAQTLRWAALLTRDRRDILGELIRLYGPKTPTDGGPPVGIQAFSPSLVDFEYWLRDKPQSRFSRIPDQIAVMSRLAKLERRAVLLNFVPFCPLRAAVEGEKWHRVIRNAILNQGFVGIKLYPPMGFQPLNNAPSKLFGQRFKVSGAKIDRELLRMYRWCNDNGVPIKAHGNNSLAADECSGKKAAPDLWSPVLDRFKDLHVNIAHFGGFEEDTPTDKCADSPPSYEERAAVLIKRHENAYVDLGYWTEVTGRNRPGTATLKKVNDLLAGNPKLGRRIMYGSDYTMIGRERQHGAYLSDLKTAISALDGVEETRVFSLNAQAYLQLDERNSPTRRRLRRFFPTGHPYFRIVGE